LTLEFFGEVQLDRELERITDRTADLTPVWDDIIDDFLRLETRQFDTQGVYSGGWSPLSPAYAARKAREFPGQPILQATGDLMRSLTRGPAVRIVRPQSVMFGSDVEYGRYHQAGTPNMPQRRPVDLPEATRRDWVQRIHRFIVTGKR
jgi:phage gpG-like protein